jgi:hypothetical protein
LSVRVMSVVWGWSLPATEKLVALKLADCADDKGLNAFPAVATIAAECGLSLRGVHNVLGRLKARGCVDVQDSQPGRSVVYRVCLDAVVEPAKAGAADEGGMHDVQGGSARGAGVGSAPGAGGVCTSFRGGVHVVQGGCAPGADDPSEIRQGSVRETPRARRAHPLDEPMVLEPWSLEAFDAVWAIYPRKDARVAAVRAWHTLAPTRDLAGFILGHVRTRLALGWGDTPARFLPQLRTFIDERRWQERYVPEARAPAAATPQLPDGMLVMRSCPSCGAEQEGRVVKGEKVFGVCGCAQEGRVEAQT